MLPQEDTVNDVFLESNEPQQPNSSIFVRSMMFLASLVTSEQQMKEAEVRIKNRKVMFPWFFGVLTLIQILVYTLNVYVYRYRYICYRLEYISSNLNFFIYTLVHTEKFSLFLVSIQQIFFGIPLEAAFGSELIGLSFIIGAVILRMVPKFGMKCGSETVNVVILFIHLSNFSLNRKTMPYRRFQSPLLLLILILDGIYFTNEIVNIGFALFDVFLKNMLCSMLGCFFGSFIINKKEDDEKWKKSWRIAIFLFVFITFVVLCYRDFDIHWYFLPPN